MNYRVVHRWLYERSSTTLYNPVTWCYSVCAVFDVDSFLDKEMKAEQM
jgi:hypothetical protein